LEIVFLLTGKTDSSEIENLMNQFEKRLKHYVRFQTIEIKQIKLKSSDKSLLLLAERDLQLKAIQDSDFLILLDENGSYWTSRGFSDQLQKWMNMGPKRLVFLVGGAFGFHEAVRNRSQASLSLSKMTFSHQIIRPIFLEQLYRAFTILKNEPYHND
jgi:23S rRNA (pseudouridine1915-N3)-methyltransferase